MSRRDSIKDHNDELSAIQNITDNFSLSFKNLQESHKETKSKLFTIVEEKESVENLLSNTVNDLNLTKKLVKEKASDINQLSKINKNLSVKVDT